MKSSTQACVTFEHDLNLFVDHELAVAHLSRITQHLEQCNGCRDFVDDLRTLSELHHDVLDDACEGDDRGDWGAEAALAAVVDKHGLFATITRKLVVEKQADLARLFYELGKAYVLAGNQGVSGILARSFVPVRKPVDIRSTTARGKQLVREVRELESSATGQAAPVPESGSLFRRSRELFSSTRRDTGGALTKGRRFLEEALALEPDLSEARIYLAMHHQCTGRFDRARVEFRRVYREAADHSHRMMALHMLGNVYAGAGDFARAVECYEKVLDSDILDREPRFFAALLNLGVNYAKLGRVDQAVRHFSDLVRRFPSRVPQLRTLLQRKESFMALLAREAALHESLQRRIPALFAA